MKIINFITLNIVVLFANTHKLIAVTSDEMHGFEYSGGPYLTGVYAFKVLLVLAIVALLAWATIYIIKKNNLRMEKTGEEITINSVKIISGDKKLIMVRAKNKEYLLAISSAGIILIDSFSNDKGAGKRIKK